MVTSYLERRCQIAVSCPKSQLEKEEGQEEAYVQHTKVHRTGRTPPSSLTCSIRGISRVAVSASRSHNRIEQYIRPCHHQ
jgi:hypothetical protein